MKGDTRSLDYSSHGAVLPANANDCKVPTIGGWGNLDQFC